MSNNIILNPTAPSGAGAQHPWKALDTLHGKTRRLHRQPQIQLQSSGRGPRRTAGETPRRRQSNSSPQTRGLGPFDPTMRIPVSIKPEEIGIIVAGGPGARSVHVPTFRHTHFVSKKLV